MWLFPRNNKSTLQYLKPAPMIPARQSIFTCPWANSFTCSPVGNSGGNLDCCRLLPGTMWSYNLRMREETAGSLKAKEKAIKSKGQSLNHASSFLTAPGWGRGLVLGDLTEQPRFVERQNLMLSPSRSSAREVCRICRSDLIVLTRESINISQRLIENGSKNTFT